MFNKFVRDSRDLVTSREETRAGFINFALEKNKKSTPYIEQAKSLRVLAGRASVARQLIDMDEIRKPLLTAAGLSDKALNYFNEEDKKKAIEELVVNFLEPAGDGFVDEVVYRYLLIKGDALGGSMRNLVGAIAQQRLVRSFLSILKITDIPYLWLSNVMNSKWNSAPEDETIVEQNVKALSWQYNGSPRILAFNINIPLVKKNVDICLFDGDHDSYDRGKIAERVDLTLMLGELKGGVDPAGADEHWKTANSALQRISVAYNTRQHPIKTLFVGAAIENAMAKEIYDQLTKGVLSNAGNLSNDEQLVEICEWILNL